MFLNIYKYLIRLLLLLSLPFLVLSAGEIDDKDSNNPEITVEQSKTVTEGNSGTKTVQLDVTIDKCPNLANIELRYETKDNSAKVSDNDYQSKNGTITFTKGSCTKTKTLTFIVNGDTKVENTENFYVKYYNNNTPEAQTFTWNNGRQQTKIYIKNDDGVVLDAGKYLVVNGKELDKAKYNLNDTVTFKIYAVNEGPNSSTIKIKDDLENGIDYIPGSIKIVNNVSNYNCSVNGSAVRCSGSHIFAPNEEAEVTFKAKVKKEGNFKNVVYITDNDGKYENGDTVRLEVINAGNGLDIQKKVDKSSAKVGDTVNFTIKVINKTPEKRIIEIRDWFPKTQNGENYSGTTHKAFENVTLPTVVEDPSHSVVCQWRQDGNSEKYISCQNSQKLKPNESFKVAFSAKVVKIGNICNRSHSYLDINGKHWMSYSDACINVGGNNAPVIDNIGDQNALIGKNFTYNLGNKISDPDNDPLTVTVTGLPNGFYYDSNSKKIKARPVTANEGTYPITVTVTDDPSKHNGTPMTATKTFNIIIKYQKIKAKDNNYTIGMNETLEANVITDDTGEGKDRGYNVRIKNFNFSTSKHGQFSIKSNGKFRYKPDQDFSGTVKFNYTIIDDKNKTSKAVVTIVVKTQFSSNFQDFKLVNPLETRNIIGNYVISGNTVECVTDKNDSYDGTCQNNRVKYYNNKYIVKYIDIDDSDDTWNSSSSKLILPNSYAPSGDGKHIVWAGLFWQGNVNNSNNFTKNGQTYQNIQRRSYLADSFMGMMGSSVQVKNINQNETLNILNTSANKVLLKIDNETEYHSIAASRFYYDSGDYGDYGATYAAYADITNLLQSKKLNKGEHKVTVANILSNEGIEQLNGDYAGWSIVVIYKEDFINGKARNISIYNGFTAVDYQEHGGQEIKISGFKLPKVGTVNSQFSVFAGEGEKKYGAPYKDPEDGRAWFDTMRIKRLQSDSGDSMPGADNPDNIFDAKLANIQRDSGKNNDIENTNGIDIDTYDVSNIITNYRNKDDNISSIYVSIDSNKDYITPSMIAFATELYAPKVCYDSDVKIGEYMDVETQDRNFTAYNYNKPLQMKVMIKSQEADFDLLDSKLKVKFTPDDVFTYRQGESKTSIPNTYEYYNAIDTDSNNSEIAIGNAPTTEGGTIGAKELTYSKMYYNFNKNKFDGEFNVVVDAKVSFDGIHKVEYQLSTEAPKGSIFNIERCQTNPVYNPVYGMFNIERGDSTFSQNRVDRYSLYTQVVGVPYEVSVAAYKKGSNNDYNEKASFNGTVELELIDASTFDNNSSSGFDSVCSDPDTYNIGKFVKFDSNHPSRVKVKVPDDFPKINNKTTYPENLALRNAAFRVWVLTKKDANNTKVVVKHNCSSQSDSSCFDTLYKNNYSSLPSGVCSSECTSSSGTTCYECLRAHFATPVCSRDNFAIRPVSYNIAISDDNETHSTTTKNLLGKNSSTASIDLAAGYIYHLDVNATKYNSNTNNADGYYLKALGEERFKKSVAIFNDSAACLDKNNTDVYTHILNGQTIGYDTNSTHPQNGLIISNSGRYRFHLEDLRWTRVDHKGYRYKPFKNHADCENNSTKIYNGAWNAKRGCDINSNDANNGYSDLNLAMHPYKFKVSGISAASNPNSGSNYIYINDLNQTTYSFNDDSVMGVKISGNQGIIAIGKNGNVLTNYTKSCSAKDLNIDIDYKTFKGNTESNITDIAGNSVQLKYSIFNKNIDTTPNINTAPINDLNMTFSKNYFKDNNTTAGKADFVSYFNFSRTYNSPVNPFTLHFGDFKATSPLDKSSVDLIQNHIPVGFNSLDTNKTVYYAKAKPKSDVYDDITTNSVNTPMMIALFCNEKLDICNNYGITTNNTITNEYDWWINPSHTPSEGHILVDSDTNKANISPKNIVSFTKGINDNVTVTAVGGVARPFTVHIVPTKEMKDNYPYLLFNKSKDEAPSFLESVTFINPNSAWSGEGQTGHAADVNQSSGRKTNKVDW